MSGRKSIKKKKKVLKTTEGKETLCTGLEVPLASCPQQCKPGDNGIPLASAEKSQSRIL